jgi:hypothetical protein
MKKKILREQDTTELKGKYFFNCSVGQFQYCYGTHEKTGFVILGTSDEAWKGWIGHGHLRDDVSVIDVTDIINKPRLLAARVNDNFKVSAFPFFKPKQAKAQIQKLIQTTKI